MLTGEFSSPNTIISKILVQSERKQGYVWPEMLAPVAPIVDGLYLLSQQDPNKLRQLMQFCLSEWQNRSYYGQQVIDIVRESVWSNSQDSPVDRFDSLDLCYCEGVMKPNPFTHELSRAVINEIERRTQKNTNIRMLEVGSGSGAVAIIGAKYGADVTAIDVSDLARKVTTINVVANGQEDNVTAMHADVTRINGKFDIVSANIPWDARVTPTDDIPERMQQLSSGAIDIESSRLAISYYETMGGKSLLQTLMTTGRNLLSDGGVIIFPLAEMDYRGQKDAFYRWASEGGYSEVEFSEYFVRAHDFIRIRNAQKGKVFDPGFLDQCHNQNLLSWGVNSPYPYTPMWDQYTYQNAHFRGYLIKCYN